MLWLIYSAQVVLVIVVIRSLFCVPILNILLRKYSYIDSFLSYILARIVANKRSRGLVELSHNLMWRLKLNAIVAIIILYNMYIFMCILYKQLNHEN